MRGEIQVYLLLDTHVAHLFACTLVLLQSEIKPELVLNCSLGFSPLQKHYKGTK